jgi:hypothetical protein
MSAKRIPFDYGALERADARKARTLAQRIRGCLKRSLKWLVAVGKSLKAAKEAVGHGHFLRWLASEFTWTARTARNLMAVAAVFGNLEMISDLRIDSTAAYVLSAPSVPEDAREVAVQRAAKGERITAAEARAIVARVRKRRRPQAHPLTPERITARLQQILDRYQRRSALDPQAFACILRQFADQMEARG